MTSYVIVNPEKCVFAASQVGFQGYVVNAHDIFPVPKILQSIFEFAAPSSLEQLWRYLGFLNFYRRFLLEIPKVVCQLTDILVGKHTPKNRRITLTSEASEAFVNRKLILAVAVQLTNLQPDALIQLASDVSNDAISIALNQAIDDTNQPRHQLNHDTSR